MRFKGFIGPSYTLQSVNVDCQRSVNLYPEINESGTGKEGEVMYLAGTPGTKTLISVGEGPIRCVHVTPSGIILVVSRNKLFKVSYDPVSGQWSSFEYDAIMNINTPLVEAESSIGEEVMFDGSPFTEEIVTFVGGDEEYLWRRFIDDSGETEVISEEFDAFSEFGYKGSFAQEPYPGSFGASHVSLVDGYRVYNKLHSGKFYTSDLESPTVDPLSFFMAEGDPDKLLAVLANHRDLWFFGERTTEIWQASGDVNAPFIRSAAGFIEQGCFARYSPRTISSTVLWLGRNKEGRGIVYMAQGYQPQRVSTHAVELAINSYANPEAATAYAYQEGGHFYYVLNFEEGTWVYDLSTRLWHERGRLDNGEIKRHRGNVYAFAPNVMGGIHLIGDYENGNLYQMSANFHTDDDEEIVRIRTAPHVTAGLKKLRHNSLQIDMEVGVGLDGNEFGSDPKAILDWSDDGGHTWSNEHWMDVGKIGQFRRRVIKRRLGMSRDRVYRLRITDKVKVVLIGAEIDIEARKN